MPPRCEGTVWHSSHHLWPMGYVARAISVGESEVFVEVVGLPSTHARTHRRHRTLGNCASGFGCPANLEASRQSSEGVNRTAACRTPVRPRPLGLVMPRIGKGGDRFRRPRHVTTITDDPWSGAFPRCGRAGNPISGRTPDRPIETVQVDVDRWHCTACAWFPPVRRRAN